MEAGNTTARANVNVALVKYWGKRDAALNLPATGSISLTLAGLGVEARVAFDGGERDRLEIDGAPAAGEEAARLAGFLDLLRDEAQIDRRAAVATRSSVPRGAGLASSAAAFAALALAGSRAAGLRLEPPALSALARRGSGSAARSIFGGFVEWRRGDRPDGRDSVAAPLATPDHWDVRVVVALVTTARKSVSSREGMARAAASPFYPAWVAAADADLAEARAAIAARDLAALGTVAERSALAMHAVGLAARPPLLYWHGATVDCMHAVWALRAEGTPAWVTIDAGPQVKVLCAPDAAPRVAAALDALPGVERVVTCTPGGGAEVVASSGDVAAGTAMTQFDATAPGKLFLAGEWAVLSGAPALVLAVERRARVRVSLADGPAGLVVASLGHPSAAAGDRVAVEAARAAAVAVVPWLANRRVLVEVDSRSFLDGERKLGLGRSAATLTAASAALLAAGGRADSDTVLAVALAANAAMQEGRGSGADVAAAVHGGLIEVTRGDRGVRVTPRRLPRGLRLLVGWTGAAAPTRPLLDRFAAAARPASLDAVADAARAAVAAVAAGDAGALCAAVDRSAAALERLGAETGVPIVTPALARLVSAARGAGAAAKPSGAGGGDCGIALVDAPGVAERVLAAWRDAGVTPLALGIAEDGVRVALDAPAGEEVAGGR